MLVFRLSAARSGQTRFPAEGRHIDRFRDILHFASHRVPALLKSDPGPLSHALGLPCKELPCLPARTRRVQKSDTRTDGGPDDSSHDQAREVSVSVIILSHEFLLVT